MPTKTFGYSVGLVREAVFLMIYGVIIRSLITGCGLPERTALAEDQCTAQNVLQTLLTFPVHASKTAPAGQIEKATYGFSEDSCKEVPIALMCPMNYGCIVLN